MWCVVPVAGEGSRLRSLTGGQPKCLVEVGGRPLLHHLLDRLEEVGDQLCVVVPPRHEPIEAALAGHAWGEGATTVVQDRPLGLCDAVSRAVVAHGAALAPGARGLVVMGDSYFSASLAPSLAPLEDGEGGLLVERGGPEPGEPAGWVSPNERGLAGHVWKGERGESGAMRIAGTFVLERVALERLAEEPGAGSFEALIDGVVGSGIPYRLLGVEGPRWNVNTPAQLTALRAWHHRTRTHGDPAPVRG